MAKLSEPEKILKRATERRQDAYLHAARVYTREYKYSQTRHLCSDCEYCMVDTDNVSADKDGLPMPNFYCRFERPEALDDRNFQYPRCLGMFGPPCANFSRKAGSDYEQAQQAEIQFDHKALDADCAYLKAKDEAKSKGEAK